MPAFTFEKISPPGSRSPVAPAADPVAARKHRGVIFQIVDRFVETRIKRSFREEQGVIVRREPKAPD